MSQHGLTGDCRRSRALNGESGEEIPRSLLKLQNRRRRRKLESGLRGKLVVREGDNPDHG